MSFAKNRETAVKIYKLKMKEFKTSTTYVDLCRLNIFLMVPVYEVSRNKHLN